MAGLFKFRAIVISWSALRKMTKSALSYKWGVIQREAHFSEASIHHIQRSFLYPITQRRLALDSR